MKLENRGDQTEGVENDVNEFLNEINDLEDVTGFICCVMLGDDKTKTLVAATPRQMMALSMQLIQMANDLEEFNEEVKGRTLQ